VPPFELEEQNRIVEREQSIALDYLNLAPGHEGSATGRPATTVT